MITDMDPVAYQTLVRNWAKMERLSNLFVEAGFRGLPVASGCAGTGIYALVLSVLR